MSIIRGDYICIFCHELIKDKKECEVMVCPHCGKTSVVAFGVEKGVRY